MKSIAVVGTGVRCYSMYIRQIFEKYGEKVKICGLYDKNPARAQAVSAKCGNPAVFDDFERMIDETRPDIVLVATIDAVHHEYIIRAMEKGCDVITEKPMTIDDEKCKQILDAEKRTGKTVTVTFNCRFMPLYSEIKKLLKEDIIGEVLHIDYQYMLDRKHGADYFRRWHRKIENSGGLLVHKSTHHFDIINWFLEDTPFETSAFGTRRFYGDTRKEKGDRCLTCAFKDSCEFYYDIAASGTDKMLYLDAEGGDGYIRDACVFSDEINICDTMAVNVKYKKGTTLSYSLVTYSPYEGWSLSLTGTKGRMEAKEFHSGNRAGDEFNVINVYDLKGSEKTFNTKKKFQSHGGGDVRLLDMLFGSDVPDDLGRMANSHDGAKSLLIGACANISINEKRIVSIEETLHHMNII